MRVLMLHNDYRQEGGEYQSVRSELRGLQSLGHETELLQLTNDGRSGAELAYRTVAGQGEARRLVGEKIREFRPDVVHAQNLFPLLGAGAISALRDTGVPWVRSLRNYRLRCIAGSCFLRGETCTRCSSASQGLPGIRYGCYRDNPLISAGAVAYAAKERAATKRYPPSAYIVLSESMKGLLGGLLDDAPTFVKANPVDAEHNGTPLPRHERTIDVLYVGRLSVEKGIDVLIHAAALLPSRRFRIVGDGPERARLEELAATVPNVHFAGRVPHEQIEQEMRAATVVAIPSAWEEPFGRTAVEAFASGTPVVVPRRGGLGEIAAGVDDAMLADVDTPEGWAAAVGGVLDLGEEEYGDLAGRCRTSWRDRYSPSVTTEDLVSIYQRVLT
jgi:glycosyltransferase involved in cell wall biosynthesis